MEERIGDVAEALSALCDGAAVDPRRSKRVKRYFCKDSAAKTFNHALMRNAVARCDQDLLDGICWVVTDADTVKTSRALRGGRQHAFFAGVHRFLRAVTSGQSGIKHAGMSEREKRICLDSP